MVGLSLMSHLRRAVSTTVKDASMFAEPLDLALVVGLEPTSDLQLPLAPFVAERGTRALYFTGSTCFSTKMKVFICC
jgi:hypothetical protein